MNILVVDDDRDIADIIGYSLRKEGHRPILAHSGEEALALAERSMPDLVVLDVMLPGLSGFAVCRKLRERGPVPDIPLTARGAGRPLRPRIKAAYRSASCALISAAAR